MLITANAKAQMIVKALIKYSQATDQRAIGGVFGYQAGGQSPGQALLTRHTAGGHGGDG